MPLRLPSTKTLYISKSTDIFSNLALEHWLYQNRTFINNPHLMVWRNQPCVVVGRHQNPWLESNFATLPNIAGGTQLARRNSGGGAVYHDLSNLNLTFFTVREAYSRRVNLEFIARTLKDNFNINAEINKREDLVIDDHKISGTASKLGRTVAYHHCTLLINADKHNLSLALQHILGQVETNATISVRSKIINLTEVNPKVTPENAMDAIINQYQPSDVTIVDHIDNLHYPGIQEFKTMFQSTAWRFLRTPKFTLLRQVFSGEVFLEVDKGVVTNLGLKGEELGEVSAKLMGRQFGVEVLNEFEMLVKRLQ